MIEMKEKIIQCLAEVLEKDVKELDEERELADFFEWDSLAVMSFVALIEQRHAKHIPATEVWHCEYVYELIDLVEEV